MIGFRIILFMVSKIDIVGMIRLLNVCMKCIRVLLFWFLDDVIVNVLNSKGCSCIYFKWVGIIIGVINFYCIKIMF